MKKLKTKFITEKNKLIDYTAYDSECVQLPNGIDTVGFSSFFAHREIKHVNMSESVQCVENYAFGECRNLREVFIGKNVRHIAPSAFDGCDNLRRIDVDARNEHYCSIDGIVYSKDMKTIARVPSGKYTDNFELCADVEVIGENAFNRNRSLTGIRLNEKLKRIDYKAFCYCGNLREIEIWRNVAEVCYCALANCASLSRITVDEGNTRYRTIDGILYSADKKSLIQLPSGKNIESFTIENEVERIEDRALTGNVSLKSITGGSLKYECVDGVLLSGDRKYLTAYPSGRKSDDYEVPKGVTVIGRSAFQFSSALKKVVLCEGVKVISSHAFEGASIEELDVNTELESIGWSAFSHCGNLKKLDFSRTKLKEADGMAFADCLNLTEVLLPKSMKNVHKYAFITS